MVIIACSVEPCLVESGGAVPIGLTRGGAIAAVTGTNFAVLQAHDPRWRDREGPARHRGCRRERSLAFVRV